MAVLNIEDVLYGHPLARRRGIIDRYPNSEVAPEAQDWAGVSKYKESNDANDLKDTAKAFKDRYSDSTWAKKASISSLNGER